MNDNISYHDLGGKRHLRSYFKAAIIILIILAGLAVFAMFSQNQLHAEISSTKTLPISQPSTFLPSASPTRPAESCPTDYNIWNFVTVMPDDQFKRIEPGCVYDGLSRTAAWVLANNHVGWTQAEASRLLGFEQAPIKLDSYQISIIGNYSEQPFAVSLSSWPRLDGLGIWNLNDQERPAVEFILTGCYRAASKLANEWQEWNRNYPVICTAYRDTVDVQFSHTELNGHHYALSRQNGNYSGRSMILFGYGGNGQWVFLGVRSDEGARFDFNSEQLENLQTEHDNLGQLYGIPVWNAAWLEATYGVTMKPLPDGWQAMTDDGDKELIQSLINEAIETKDRNDSQGVSQ